MMLFRPAHPDDVESLYQLALDGGVGLTTLPKDKSQLSARVKLSEDSFNKKINEPENENYLFVLEDTLAHKVVGVSAIEAAVGMETPFYSYKISRKSRLSHELNIRSDYKILSLVNDYQGHSEICTLFLDKNYRVKGNGLLLSKARFLYMANFPKRFSKTVIAEMRGVSDAAGHSPFWEGVGQHFFQMPFSQADQLTSSTNKQFIADLMPTTPIHISLLAEEAQQVIGKPHQSTIPAVKILEKEGFRYTGYVDIFDAGPSLEVPLNDIKTIKNSQLYTIRDMIDEVNDNNYFVANTKPRIRASIGNILVDEQNLTCILSHKLAELLEVTEGDQVRISQFT